MNQRGESNSTAIVALVMLALVALGVFMFYGGGRRNDGAKIDVDINRPAPAPAAPAAPAEQAPAR
jgi:hypothetical protein